LMAAKKHVLPPTASSTNGGRKPKPAEAGKAPMMSEAMITQVPDAATPYTSGMRSQRSPAGGPLKDNAHWVTLYTTRRFSLGASDSANTPSAKSTPEIEDQPQTVPIKRPEHAQPAIRARASGVRHESGTTKIQDVTRIDAGPGALGLAAP